MLFSSKKKEPAVLRKKVKPRRLSVLQVQIVVGVTIAIVLGLLITAVWYTTRIPSLQIIDVQVIGGQTISHAQVKSAVEEVLSGTYVRLIPKRFMLFYPQEAVRQKVISIDRVKQVQVEMSDDQTLTVVFDEHIPYALWCSEVDSTDCIFIDGTGFAFSHAPSLTGSAFVRYIEEKEIPEVGKVSFDSTFIKETELFIDLLREKLSLYVTNVVKIGSYDIEYIISGGGVIKVSQSITMEETFANLETILSSEEFIHIEPGAFQYIDLRFGDKVFVNEVMPGESATTTASTTVAE